MKKFILLIVLMMMLVGCGKEKPSRHPRHQNFDFVKVTLSGEKAQIVNNKLEFDTNRNCWLVQVKMENASSTWKSARRFLSKRAVQNGALTHTLYEGELEPWED